MNIAHKLATAGLAAALGITGASLPVVIGTNAAYATDVTTQHPKPQQRSYTPRDGEGLKLTLHKGDRVDISGDTATIVDETGKEISSIRAELPSGYLLEFDSEASTLTPVSTAPKSFGERSAKSSCTNNKWAKWFVRGAGVMLVCVPATIGATGVSGPGGIAVAAGCGIGVEGAVTAISCD